MVKTLNNTYLFTQYSQYEKELMEFIMTANEINKGDDSFEDIRASVKRCRISSNFIKLLDSKNIILMDPIKPLPRSLKVFTAKDIKHNHALKTFIDCSGIIYKDEDGNYAISNSDKLIAFLLDAMVTHIYFGDNKKLLMNSTVTSASTECFASLFTHIIDYVGKISIVPGLKNKCEYMSVLYFQSCVLGKDAGSDSVRALARKLSGLSEREEDIISIQVEDGAYENLKLFVSSIAKVLKLDKLTLDTVVEKWMYLYGPGTVFGLEFFPAFSNIITDAYVGCFINNQKTIEKVVGTPLIEYTKKILSIGGEVL